MVDGKRNAVVEHTGTLLRRVIEIAAGLALPGLLVFFIVVNAFEFGETDEQSIERSRDPAWLVEVVSDDGRDPRLRRLARVRLADLADERPEARDEIAALLAAVRDAAPEGPTRSGFRQNLSVIHHETLLAHETALLDRVVGIVGVEGKDGFRGPAEFSPLEQAASVDLVIDLMTKDGETGFTRRIAARGYEADYARSPFFGLTGIEMDALAAQADRVALVHRRSEIVGSVTGACSGVAFREHGDVYVVSLRESRVIAAATVQGRSPPGGGYETAVSTTCDVSGGPAPVEGLITYADR
jgi:hypothetical protein